MWRYFKRGLSHLPIALRQVVLCTKHGSRRSHSSRWISDNTSQQSHQLGEAFKRLADAFCNCLLWHRIDGYCLEPVRLSTIRSRSFQIQPKASRLDDCRWQNFHKNDAGASADLFANDGTKVGHFNGSVRLNWRSVRYICSCARRRPVYARRHLCAGLSTKARNAHRRRHGNSTYHRRGQHTLPFRWPTEAAWNQSRNTDLQCCRYYNRCVLNLFNLRSLSSENSNV